MTEQERLYKKVMGQINRLHSLNRYDKATVTMRAISCENLILAEDTSSIHEQGIDDYYTLGDVLISCGKDFGERAKKSESYESWCKRAKKELHGLYKCKLTGKDCIAKIEDFHFSDIREGNSCQAIVKVDLQTRCPAFKNRLEEKTK